MRWIHRWKHLLPVVFILVLASLWQGCGQKRARPYSGPPTKLVLGVYRGEAAALVYAADLFGHFKPLGLDVELRDFESGAAAVTALTEGRVDLATGADFVFASNIEKHPDLRILASTNSVKNFYVVARRDRGIQRPSDIKGKRVALTKMTPGEIFLEKYLNGLRMAMTDVTTVPMTPTMMEKGLVAGSIDAAISWDPVARRMRDSLGAAGVAWPAQGETPYHFVLITKDRLIEQQAPALERLMKALVLAETSMRSDPVAAQSLLAKRLGMPESYLAEVWKDNHYGLALDRSLLRTLEVDSRWISNARGEQGFHQPNYMRFIHLNALEAVRPESVTIIH